MAITPYSPVSNIYNSPEINNLQQSLTSGQRINNAADDPAGLAVVTALTTQINTQDVGIQNANNGISLIQTADGASASINGYLARMNELAVQAANGTLNDSQRSILNLEFQQNLEALNGVANNTQFNGQTLLNGDTSNLDIALGEGSSTLNLPNQTSTALGIDGLDILNPANASSALEGISSAVDLISQQRAEFGAQQNGLTSAIDNLQNQNVNSQASRSQILDTDFAKAIAEQIRQNILQDSSIAMQAQNNQSRASVLQLLNS